MAIVIGTETPLPETISARCSGIFIYAPNPYYGESGQKITVPQYIIHKYDKLSDNGQRIKADEFATYKMNVSDLLAIKFPNGITGQQVVEALLWFNDNRNVALSQVMTQEQIDVLDIKAV